MSSKLDTNNSLLHGLPDTLLNKLQVLQNAAARLVMRLPKHWHIAPILRELHWLPVQQRIQFKILLFVFKALNDLPPTYIAELLVRKPQSTRSLRSIKICWLFQGLTQSDMVTKTYAIMDPYYGMSFLWKWEHVTISKPSKDSLKLCLKKHMIYSFVLG